MRALSYVLIALSIVYFAMGQVTFERKEKVLDIGPIEATQTTQESFPFSPVVCGALLLSGTALLIASTVRKS